MVSILPGHIDNANIIIGDHPSVVEYYWSGYGSSDLLLVDIDDYFITDPDGIFINLGNGYHPLPDSNMSGIYRPTDSIKVAIVVGDK